LTLERARLRELARDGRVEQLVVWDAAPQEEREPRRERHVVEPLDLAGRGTRGRRTAEQELGPRDHAHERELHTALEARLFACGAAAVARAVIVEVEQHAELVVRDGPAVGAPREAREDVARAVAGGERRARAARENRAPRRRVARAARLVRPRHEQPRDARPAVGVVAWREIALERLEQPLVD